MIIFGVLNTILAGLLIVGTALYTVQTDWKALPTNIHFKHYWSYTHSYIHFLSTYGYLYIPYYIIPFEWPIDLSNNLTIPFRHTKWYLQHTIKQSYWFTGSIISSLDGPFDTSNCLMHVYFSDRHKLSDSFVYSLFRSTKLSNINIILQTDLPIIATVVFTLLLHFYRTTSFSNSLIYQVTRVNDLNKSLITLLTFQLTAL